MRSMHVTHEIHPPPRERRRFVVGTMTGTSIDGDLDAALVEITGSGIAMRTEFVVGHSHPLGDLAADLRRVASQEPLAASAIARIARAFGEAHADALSELCSRAGVSPDLAVLHGQTIFHAPPLTWQLLDPWPVATRLQCRVRYDLRSANTASGGQGAPITPLADFVLFGSTEDLIVMNLGGFINATLVPSRERGIEAIRGFDVCACNHLLDRVARTRLGTAFDKDGEAARRGIVHESISRDISHAIAPELADDHRRDSIARRSLGTGDEAARLVELTSHLSPSDACRTVADAIADAAVRVILPESVHAPARILLAGGSARNQALRAAIAHRTRLPVQTTAESHGIPIHMREAAEIAILGALADDGVRYALPQVTGTASHVMDSAVIEQLGARSGPTSEPNLHNSLTA
ncbi:MAG: Anhydro-N-acetylmuramic acid kinase [Planctomycetota bacterium]